jgi:hypothetical protein
MMDREKGEGKTKDYTEARKPETRRKPVTVRMGGIIEAFSLGARASCPHKPTEFDK